MVFWAREWVQQVESVAGQTRLSRGQWEQGEGEQGGRALSLTPRPLSCPLGGTGSWTTLPKGYIGSESRWTRWEAEGGRAQYRVAVHLWGNHMENTDISVDGIRSQLFLGASQELHTAQTGQQGTGRQGRGSGSWG